MVFQTGSNVTNRRVIFEEGGTIRGLNLYINSGNLYAGAWNTANDGAGAPWSFTFTNTPISASTNYIVSFVYNFSIYLKFQLIGFYYEKN